MVKVRAHPDLRLETGASCLVHGLGVGEGELGARQVLSVSMGGRESRAARKMDFLRAFRSVMEGMEQE